MITLQNLFFSYGKHDVLKGIDIEIPDGGMTALLGSNGAGKTTLFRCILGLLPHYRGNILIDGKSLSAYSPQELAEKIAYIPQSSYPVFNYTVLDMVLMGTTQQVGYFSAPGQEQIALARKALDRLGISSMENREFLKLSGGERQLVLIARAIAQKARLLMMDEPCSALDFGNQCMVMRVMRELSQTGYTVIMSTHQPQHALSYCDRVVAISEGKVLCQGTPVETMNEDLMQKLYGVSAVFVETDYGKVVLAKQ